jgi:hypothetical protein
MWVLQTPEATSQKLLSLIGAEAGKATRGGGAFAFVTAAGARMLEAEPGFKALLAKGKFVMVVGMDAITDANALDAVQSIAKSNPNFEPFAFMHSKSGSLFHPKTVWFRSASGGSIIAGSGNLTPGGLNKNWEAASLLSVGTTDIEQHEAAWEEWLKVHNACLLPLDHKLVVEQARLNKIQKSKVKKALVIPDEDEGADEVVATTEDGLASLDSGSVLIAEVPKSGDRWKQVNFDIATYQNYFGVTLGSGKDVEFRQVRDDGSLGPAEHRHAVAVKSQNYRFEVGAAANLPYPAKGHPILVFLQISDQLFFYVLLMPGEQNHTLIQKYLDDNYASSRSKRRVTLTLSALRKAWPDAPFSS